MRRMKITKTCFGLLFGLLLSFGSAAQSIQSKSDKTKYSIGDVIELTFRVPFAKGETQDLIYTKPNTDTLELQATLTDTLTENGKTYLRYRQRYMSFIAGDCAVGDSLWVKSSGKAGETLYTILPASVQIESYPIDTLKAEVRDIKALQQEPFSISEILPLIYLFLALAAAGVGLYFLIRHFRNRPVEKKEEIAPKVYVSPHVRALQALEDLRLRRLSEQGLKKEYYSELTDILRSYIEESFSVSATDMTTSQICNWLKEFSKTAFQPTETAFQIFETAKEILQTADYVKFAK